LLGESILPEGEQRAICCCPGTRFWGEWGFNKPFRR
jgi:hypothetical protein